MDITKIVDVKEKNKINLMDYISILSIVILIIFFTLVNKNFINLSNIRNILTDLSPLLVIGCGVTFVLLIGSIDLSIGAIASCGAVLLVVLIPKIGGWAYIVAMVYGLLAGVINGVLYTKVKIPSFIATLGTMSVWQSIAYLLSGGAPLQIAPKYWTLIGWGKMKFGILSMPLIIALLVITIFFVVQRNTKLGKFSFAIGANERAARLSGINTDFTKICVYSICGLCSALAGVFLSVKLRSGIPTVGDPFTLLAVAAVALGGTSLSGGKGGVLGTILGVALVTVIQNGMNVIGVNAFWQQIVFGLIVIAAVYITVDRKGRNIIIK